MEISTHCIPVTGVIVPTQGEFLQALESAAATLGEIREAVGPRIDEVRISDDWPSYRAMKMIRLIDTRYLLSCMDMPKLWKA